MRLLTALAFSLLASTPALAEKEPVKICVYDPAGKTGDYYQIMDEFAVNSTTWGAQIELKPYTDEETAAKDYEAGSCDGVVATGVRLQRFNRFPSTIEAVGALPDYALLEQMVDTLTRYESAGAKLSHAGNQTVGILPVGAVYLFVRDRSIDTVGELAGQRIATLDYDKPSLTMVGRVGAIVVPADLGSIGPKFNNGDVTACYVSAPAYQPFELHRGLEASGGGIIRAPLAQATLQVMIRQSAFPEGYAKKARTFFRGQFQTALTAVQKAEAGIPAKYWIEVPPDRFAGWDEMFRNTRVHLRDEVGSYDASMLNVMFKLRCAKEPSRAECAEGKE